MSASHSASQEKLSQLITKTNGSPYTHQQVESLLQKNQAFLPALLEISSEAIISIDQQQQIILFNKGAEAIFGYASKEVIGQPLDILLPQRFVESHHFHIKSFAESETTSRLMGERREIFGRRKNGQEFPAEASISKLQIDDGFIFTVLLRDITERKQAETEQEKLITQLKALNEAIQAINAKNTLEQVLQSIIQSARDLLQTKYAALGVFDSQGYLSRFLALGLSPETQARIGALPVGRGLLGHLLHHGESLLLNDLANHPAATGFPAHHPIMQKLLGVPIYAKGELVGAFYLADKEDGADFDESDQHLLEMLARHAAVAIENARLYEKTQQLAILEERNRFARDLHDGIIQSVYGVGLSLDQVRVNIHSENEAAQELIDASLNSLAVVINELRNYIFDLRPQALDRKGLERRLDGLLKELRVNTHLPIQANISAGVDNYLSDTQASHIFHIAHEVLSNAARHAKAGQLSVNLTCEDGLLLLKVVDDGIGFRVPDEVQPGHHGLGNIRSRAEQIGATLEIDSNPGAGTRVVLRLRLGQQPPDQISTQSVA